MKQQLRASPAKPKPESGLIQIFVKSLDGKTFLVKVRLATTVLELKKMLEDQEGIPAAS